MSGLSAAAGAHPLETIFIVLLGGLLLSWALGINGALHFFGVFFAGFLAAVLFMVAGFLIVNGKLLIGLVLIIAGFGLIGALSAGWVAFG